MALLRLRRGAMPQKLRASVDAILVGAETIRADNPRLTVRGKPGAETAATHRRLAFGKLPRAGRIFADRFAKFTTVYRDIGLRDLLRKLGANEITSVLIEGGGNVLGQALDERLIDKVQIYIAPTFTGGPTVAFAGAGADSTQSAARVSLIQYGESATTSFLSDTQLMKRRALEYFLTTSRPNS